MAWDNQNFLSFIIQFPETLADLEPGSAFLSEDRGTTSDVLALKALRRSTADDTTIPYDFDNDPFYDEDITGVVMFH